MHLCITGAPTCPQDHPYAYLDGKYCCQSDREKVYEEEGEKCDGSVISRQSTCCLDNAYAECPDPDGNDCYNYNHGKFLVRNGYIHYAVLLTKLETNT